MLEVCVSVCVCDNIRHISYCKLEAKKSLVATELRTEEGLLVSASSLRAGTKSLLYLNTCIRKYRASYVAKYIICSLKEQKKEEEDDFLSQDFFFLFMPFSTVLIEI